MTKIFTTYKTSLISWVDINGHSIGLNETPTAMRDCNSNTEISHAEFESWDEGMCVYGPFLCL